MIVNNILIGLTTILFITLVLLLGWIYFDKDDWKNK